MEDAIVGSSYQTNVAIVQDYDNIWDGELDVWHGPYNRRSTQAWYAALQHSQIPADVVFLQAETTLADLTRYTCLIYPHPAILPESTGELLRAYVEQGGTVVFGCRTGYKDTNGHCPMRPMPGPVAELCGFTVEDFTLIGPHQPAPSINWPEQDDEDVELDRRCLQRHPGHHLRHHRSHRHLSRRC